MKKIILVTIMTISIIMTLSTEMFASGIEASTTNDAIAVVTLVNTETGESFFINASRMDISEPLSNDGVVESMCEVTVPYEALVGAINSEDLVIGDINTEVLNPLTSEEISKEEMFVTASVGVEYTRPTTEDICIQRFYGSWTIGSSLVILSDRAASIRSGGFGEGTTYYNISTNSFDYAINWGVTPIMPSDPWVQQSAASTVKITIAGMEHVSPYELQVVLFFASNF